ncbi:MAG: YbjN domain-containing protein [Candidatus Lernaella stagnicola]|nr:YbjN domain-containing protein [Candidatus Lernaella stagnicola]
MGLFGSGSGTLIQQVEEFLKANDWKFTVMDDNSLIRMGFQGDNGSWTCLIRCKEKEGFVLIYSILPNNIPEPNRQAIAEYLTRANYGMRVGNFEMDFEDGEVRCKTGISINAAEITQEIIKDLLYINLVTTDKYLPGINKVVYGDANPAETIQQIES